MRIRTTAFVALALIGASSRCSAQEKATPVERADLDHRTATAAFEACTAGTQIYNKGNHEGCRRLYQGALLAVLPMLDGRPKLAERVKEALEKSDAMKAPVEAAFVLREALDAVQGELAGARPAAAPPKGAGGKKESLWERLGGERTVRAAAHDFAVSAFADPKVNFTRGGKFPLDPRGAVRLEQALVEMLSAASDGPLRYTGPPLKDALKGMKVTESEFAAAAADLAASLKKFKVSQPEADELLAALAAKKGDIVEAK